MKKFVCNYIQKQNIISILIVSVLGCLNHFLYKWFHHSALIALFCPVNESVWEHLKLLYFPFLFVTVGVYLIRRPDILSFFYCRFLAVICGMFFIITAFFTYTGILGTHLLFMDILIYFCGVFLTFYFDSSFQNKGLAVPSQNIVFSLWIIVSLCFFVFTCLPPDVGLFFPL